MSDFKHLETKRRAALKVIPVACAWPLLAALSLSVGILWPRMMKAGLNEFGHLDTKGPAELGPVVEAVRATERLQTNGS